MLAGNELGRAAPPRIRQTDDLDDLTSIELSDDFIVSHLDHHFDETYARQTMQQMCRSFVHSFVHVVYKDGQNESGTQGNDALSEASADSNRYDGSSTVRADEDWITHLHCSLADCDGVLVDIESILERFLNQLRELQNEIGDVHDALARRGVQLANTRTTEQVLWTAVSRLVLPPEVVQVIAQTSEEELGRPFQLCLVTVLTYLHYRKGTWSLPASAFDDTGARTHTHLFPTRANAASAAATMDGAVCEAEGSKGTGAHTADFAHAQAAKCVEPIVSLGGSALRAHRQRSTTSPPGESVRREQSPDALLGVGARAQDGTLSLHRTSENAPHGMGLLSFRQNSLSRRHLSVCPCGGASVSGNAAGTVNTEQGVAESFSCAPLGNGKGQETGEVTHSSALSHTAARPRREMRLPLAECQVYAEMSHILDDLTLLACVKIKSFLTRKLAILTPNNTNICILQEQSLKQFAPYVHFLRVAPSLLRHAASAVSSVRDEDLESGTSAVLLARSQPTTSAAPEESPSAHARVRRHTRGALSDGYATASVKSNSTSGADVANRVGATTLANASASASPTLSKPHIARALYHEFRHEYCALVSELYLRKMQNYVFLCNSMEYSTTRASMNSLFGGGVGSLGVTLTEPVHGGGGGGGAPRSSLTNPGSRGSSSSIIVNGMSNGRSSDNAVVARGDGGVSTRHTADHASNAPPTRAERTRTELSAALPSKALSGVDYVYVLPLLLDTRSLVSFIQFRLGSRGAVALQRLQSPPLIPVVERAARRRHPYEETFRSMLSICSDMLTHEKLFTLAFFAGDASVWVSVLGPTWQFMVDYVSEVMLTRATGTVRRRMNEFPHTSVNDNAKNDCFGLLLCIRLCYEYRVRLMRERWLSDVGALFDSLLFLLWPAFKTTFGSQLASFGSLAPRPLWPCMAQLKKLEEQVRFVHPVVKNYTEFCASVLSLALGSSMTAMTHASERRARARETEVSSTTTTAPRAESEGNCDDSSSSLWPAADESVSHLDWTQLRERALRAIIHEGEVSRDVVDGVDSDSELAVLQSNLTFMQVQLVDFLQDMADYIMEHTPQHEMRLRLYPLRMCFVLNNLHHLRQNLYHHPILETGLEEGGSGVAYREYEDVVIPTLYERADFSALDRIYTRHRGEFVDAIIRMFLPGLCYVVHRSDINSDNNATGNHPGSQHDAQNPSRAATDNARSSQDDNTAKERRSESEGGDPGAILRAADSFIANWRAGLNGIRDTVAHLIADPVHAREVTAQACMECLLYNTRFHAAMGVSLARYPDVFAERNIRSLIVTNQNLMQHMRTLGTVDHFGSPS